MRRRSRIALEVLGPPLLGTILFESYLVAATLDLRTLEMLPGLLFFAFFFEGLPSVGFALVMELAFWRGLDPRSWRSVLLATSLGTVSGLALKPFFMLLGLVVGCVLGLLIRRWSGRSGSPGATSDRHGAG